MNNGSASPLLNLLCGARSSRLSQAQFSEVAEEIFKVNPLVSLKPVLVDTIGDKDRTTSLRDLGKTDFFTKELDELLLKGAIRIAIHSAKDLPDPLPQGLQIAALTKGVDPRDSLVIPFGSSLKPMDRIAVSSYRREEAVRELFPFVQFIDVRGTIEERLALLTEKKAEGVVIAEAALIRLKLTDLNRIYLPQETAPLQGRLAIVCRENDREMIDLFASIHH